MIPIKGLQVFPNWATGLLCIRPINLCALDPSEAASVGLDHAGVNGEALATHQTGFHAAAHHVLKHGAQNVTVAEPAMAIDREGRVIGDSVLKAEPTKPAIGQVKFNLLTQSPFRADRIAVTNQQHADHQFRINRRTARVAVKGF